MGRRVLGSESGDLERELDERTIGSLRWLLAAATDGQPFVGFSPSSLPRYMAGRHFERSAIKWTDRGTDRGQTDRQAERQRDKQIEKAEKASMMCMFRWSIIGDYSPYI